MSNFYINILHKMHEVNLGNDRREKSGLCIRHTRLSIREEKKCFMLIGRINPTIAAQTAYRCREPYHLPIIMPRACIECHVETVGKWKYFFSHHKFVSILYIKYIAYYFLSE